MQPAFAAEVLPSGSEGSSLGLLALALASAVLVLGSAYILYTRVQRQTSTKPQLLKSAPANGAPQEEKEEDVLHKVQVVVLYGSQTGTAEGFAKAVRKELEHKLGGKAKVADQDLDLWASSDKEYLDKLSGSESIALFLVATYGDGEPTDNAARFCRLLARLAEELEAAEDAELGGADVSLEKLTYAVFGLGNRQYEHFNAVGKVVDKQLHALGARRLLDLALGDDDKDIEDDLTSWKAAMSGALEVEVDKRWKELNKDRLSIAVVHHANGGIAMNGVSHLNGCAAEHLEEEEDGWNAAVNNLDVTFYEEGSREARAVREVAEFFEGGEAWHGHTIVRVPVVLSRELHTAASPRSCLHFELDLDVSAPKSLGNSPQGSSQHSAGPLHYSPGDHVAVFPQNEDADVECAAELLGLRDKLGSAFVIRPAPGSPPSAAALAAAFSRPVRLDTALRSIVDLHASPRKAALLLLASHAKDPQDAARLRHLASSEGKEEYLQWVLQSQRSLLEVLQAFPSARPPLSVFLTTLAPRLQPRFYSISSSLSLCRGRLSITCAVVDDVTPAGRAHRGVCSFYFKRKALQLDREGPLEPSQRSLVSVPIFLRSSTFRLPPLPATPIIMVGPGTGVAPFRGFLQERQAVLGQQGRGVLGAAVLFFGCRSRQQDYIYQEELQGWHKSGVLTELHVAFSREGPTKIYVQNLLAQKSALVWELWHKNRGFLYVCGDAKHMARDVHATLVSIAQEQERISASEAEAIVRDMQHDGRYQRDVW